MSQQTASFIKIPTDKTGGFQTLPTEPEKRLPNSDIRIELCTEKDADKIVHNPSSPATSPIDPFSDQVQQAEGLYTCFSQAWWDQKEPPELAPHVNLEMRKARMAKRLLPALNPKHTPHTYFVKAVLAATSETVGIAGWHGPGNPSTHCIFRRDAIDHYGWKEAMGWTDEEIEEMYSHVSNENWSGQFAKDDEMRREILGEEGHWYLAPLLTWPEYQGRGIGKRLLSWAIEQADSTEPVTPMYLESAPTARAVYMHVGFVPQGEYNFLRRGPAVVRGLEADEEGREDGEQKGKLEKGE
jgi:GNAT superfamily N-acetyltransferase